MNKSKTKKKKVMSDKALTKLLKQEQEKISKFKYNVRKDKTMKRCHNFCKNDYLPEKDKKNPVTVKSFKSEKDAADYQQHQAHKDFQTVLKPHMEKVFVVDYWMK